MASPGGRATVKVSHSVQSPRGRLSHSMVAVFTPPSPCTVSNDCNDRLVDTTSGIAECTGLHVRIQLIDNVTPAHRLPFTALEDWTMRDSVRSARPSTALPNRRSRPMKQCVSRAPSVCRRQTPRTRSACGQVQVIVDGEWAFDLGGV